jgi:hypothetical protein
MIRNLREIFQFPKSSQEADCSLGRRQALVPYTHLGDATHRFFGGRGFVDVVSQLGGQCRLRHPWSGGTVTLYRDGAKAEAMDGPLLKFSTRKGESIRVAQPGT